MDERLKAGIALFKQYCDTFGLKPTANKSIVEEWQSLRGPIFAAAFINSKTKQPPVIHLAPNGDITIEQDEDLLHGAEAAVAVIDPDLIKLAIEHKKRIHTIFEA